MLVAAVQMCSGSDRDANLEKAEKLIRLARHRGADLVVLPEHFSFRGQEDKLREHAEEIPGPLSRWAQKLCKSLGIWLLAGTIPERAEGCIYNTAIFINPEGEIVATYRKIHLFDVTVGTSVYRESAVFTPGNTPCAVQTPVGNFGLAICYDIRFPELFRYLSKAGVEVFLIPASFAMLTGKDHWEVLLRATAIENQAYVVASNQIGESPENKISYGHSMIIDPWGIIIGQASDIETVVTAEVNWDYLRNIRLKYPFLAHRKMIV